MMEPLDFCSDVMSADTQQHRVSSHNNITVEGTVNNGFVDDNRVLLPQDVSSAAETDMDVGHHGSESGGEHVGHNDGDVGHDSSESYCVNVGHRHADVGHCNNELDSKVHDDVEVGHCVSDAIKAAEAVANTSQCVNNHTDYDNADLCQNESDFEDLCHGDADLGRCRSESEVKVVVVADTGTHRNIYCTEHADAERRTATDIIATSQCRSMTDGPDGGRIIDGELVACNVTPRNVNSGDTINHHGTISSDENREPMSPGDVIVTHTLPSYSVSLSNGRLVTRHQTSSALRRHRKVCSECCLHCIVMATSLRFLLAAVLLMGAGCMAGGIALGAVNMSAGNDYFTLSAVFVGLGVLLVVIVLLTWRYAQPGYEPCHSLFNISSSTTSSADASQSNSNHWHGGTFYSEFQYETPPPAYSSLHQLQQSTAITAAAAADADDDDDDENVNAMIHSNPPSYRSHVSRRCHRAASNGWSPPDYVSAMSNQPGPPRDGTGCVQTDV